MATRIADTMFKLEIDPNLLVFFLFQASILNSGINM